MHSFQKVVTSCHLALFRASACFFTAARVRLSSCDAGMASAKPVAMATDPTSRVGFSGRHHGSGSPRPPPRVEQPYAVLLTPIWSRMRHSGMQMHPGLKRNQGFSWMFCSSFWEVVHLMMRKQSHAMCDLLLMSKLDSTAADSGVSTE